MMNMSDLLQNKHTKGQNEYGDCIYCKEEVEWRTIRVYNHVHKCDRFPNDVRDESVRSDQSNERYKDSSHIN